MRFVIDLAYLLTGIGISPWVIYRMIRQKRYRTGWANRLGKITRRAPTKKSIWLHAVSVGEVNATRTIVKELKERFPENEIVISTTTDTGFARASALYAAEHSVFYFPLDFSWIVRRAFRQIRPAICLLMELEVWPNFVDTACGLDVPVVVVNARITRRSCYRYGKIKSIARRIFQKVTLILAQTEEYAGRFIQIGAAAERVIVTGSLKYDTAQISDTVEGADALAEQLNIAGTDRVWVAGGTGNDEEKILLDVYRELKRRQDCKDLRLVIVPRKPERFDEVARLIADAGFDYVRYSKIKGTVETLPDKPPIILGDTMGDLRKFYSLATIVFVGRSLVPMGGSDMIEAAALGKVCLFGPHTFNFTQTVDALLEGNGAILVKDKQDLLQAMQKCLSEPSIARQIAENGRDVIKRNQGATARAIDEIAKFLSNGRRGFN